MKKSPKPVTRARLEAAALRYVSRHAATKAMLRRVLSRQVKKAAPPLPEETGAWITAICADYEKRGWVDDQRLADHMAAGAASRGTSKRMLVLKMRQRGMEEATIRTAITRRREEHPDEDDLAAARHFAQRKSLGPWRKGRKKEEDRVKDMARLCRAGFSAETAREALKAD